MGCSKGMVLIIVPNSAVQFFSYEQAFNFLYFIQLQLVSELGLSTRDTSPLRVMVGNGQQLECTRVCEEVSVVIQSTQFTVDLHVLPIAGANVVLGVQWLKSLGPVLTDYNTLCMKFFHAGNLSPLPSKLLLPLNESTKLIHTQLRKSLEFEDQGNLHNQIEKKVMENIKTVGHDPAASSS
ncbi:hypothetical protein HKD37_03G006918 [Glycine soja]